MVSKAKYAVCMTTESAKCMIDDLKSIYHGIIEMLSAIKWHIVGCAILLTAAWLCVEGLIALSNYLATNAWLDKMFPYIIVGGYVGVVAAMSGYVYFSTVYNRAKTACVNRYNKKKGEQ